MADRKIIAAAVKLGPLVISAPPPARHAVLIGKVAELTGEIIAPEGQGFLTSDGIFVSRRVAYGIAQAANQITRASGRGEVLYTDDMW